MTPEPLALFLGIGIGFILGLTGAGGGVLAVPALVLVLGFSLPGAAPVALFAVGSAAAIGAYHGWRRHEVRYRAAMVMAAAGAVTAPLGIIVAAMVDRRLLTLLFCGVMLIVALRMLRSTFKPAAGSSEPLQSKPCRVNPATGQLRWTLPCTVTIALIGACSGFGTGLLGVGGGFIIVPSLNRFSDIKTHQVIATSLLAIALIAMVSVISAVWHGVVFDSVALLFIFGSVAGMLLGRLLIKRFAARWLLRGFGVLMLLVAAFLGKSALT